MKWNDTWAILSARGHFLIKQKASVIKYLIIKLKQHLIEKKYKKLNLGFLSNFHENTIFKIFHLIQNSMSIQNFQNVSNSQGST